MYVASVLQCLQEALPVRPFRPDFAFERGAADRLAARSADELLITWVHIDIKSVRKTADELRCVASGVRNMPADPHFSGLNMDRRRRQPCKKHGLGELECSTVHQCSTAIFPQFNIARRVCFGCPDTPSKGRKFALARGGG